MDESSIHISFRWLSPFHEKYVENEQEEDFYSWSDEWGNQVSHFQKGYGDNLCVIDWYKDEKDFPNFSDILKLSKEFVVWKSTKI